MPLLQSMYFFLQYPLQVILWLISEIMQSCRIFTWNNATAAISGSGFSYKKMQRFQTESLQANILLTADRMSHRYAVGLSADISAASVSLISLCFVPVLYHIHPANHEESLNVRKRKYYQKKMPPIKAAFFASYIGYWLLISSSTGRTSVKMLTAQG